MWTMAVFFAWILWFWFLIMVFSDLFRRRDVSGWGKFGWMVFVIVLPFIGTLIYLISQGTGMEERRTAQAQASQARFDDYVRSVSSESGGAAQIAKAKELLDSGAITRQEYEALKKKALTA
jgi:hypothetical protein